MCDASGDGTAGAGLQLAVLVPTAKSWPTGRASIGAIALAIEAVNDKAASLGEERKIAYRWAEVDCNRPQAIAALTRMLEEGPIDAVIGPHCSLTCESTAFLTAGRGIPQVSYSCSSPELSSKETFPTVRLRFARSFAGAFCRPLWRNVAVCSLFAPRRVTPVGRLRSSSLCFGRNGHRSRSPPAPSQPSRWLPRSLRSGWRRLT